MDNSRTDTYSPGLSESENSASSSFNSLHQDLEALSYGDAVRAAAEAARKMSIEFKKIQDNLEYIKGLMPHYGQSSEKLRQELAIHNKAYEAYRREMDRPQKVEAACQTEGLFQAINLVPQDQLLHPEAPRHSTNIQESKACRDPRKRSTKPKDDGGPENRPTENGPTENGPKGTKPIVEDDSNDGPMDMNNLGPKEEKAHGVKGPSEDPILITFLNGSQTNMEESVLALKEITKIGNQATQATLAAPAAPAAPDAPDAPADPAAQAGSTASNTSMGLEADFFNQFIPGLHWEYDIPIFLPSPPIDPDALTELGSPPESPNNLQTSIMNTGMQASPAASLAEITPVDTSTPNTTILNDITNCVVVMKKLKDVTHAKEVCLKLPTVNDGAKGRSEFGIQTRSKVAAKDDGKTLKNF